ncbi:MAG: hypothetical protein MJ051_03460 [Akkermansia sp.]|nr:hypothetical protein [Akkermansia sp.]
MKRTLFYTSLGAALLASCSPEPAVPALPAMPTAPAAAHHAAPAPRYVALPGQAAVAVNSDVDAAFDQQVAAYAGHTPAVQVPTAPAAPTVDISAPVAPAADVTSPAVPAPTADVTAPAAPAPVADVTAAPTGGSMNYKVRITNDTPGRVFVEAQDAAGTIYPCGFMEGGRTFTTPMENAAPIKGPITVVVRDPDQPGAPEIRRYKVDPPTSSYDGKAVGVNILSGGRYMASVDGQVYYCTPAPEEPAPQPNQPAAPEAPAPAAPAAPAPAPEPAPAA